MKLLENLYWYPEGGKIDCNTYLILGDMNILVDVCPSNSLVDRIRKDGIKSIDLVLATHFHPDHFGGSEVIRKEFGAKLARHPLQKPSGIWRKSAASFLRLGGLSFKEDFYIENLNNVKMLHTPGHSDDSISFYFQELKFLLCGDVIFKGSVSGYDFFWNERKLRNSIKMLAGLDADYLLPGHGGIIKGKEEIKKNFEEVLRSQIRWVAPKVMRRFIRM